MDIAIVYDYTHKLPLIFIQNCDNFRCLGYDFTFSLFEHNEVRSRFELCTHGEGGTSKICESVRKGGGSKSIN